MKSKVKITRIGVKKDKVKTPAKTKSETISDLRGLFIDQLKDMYWSEKALVKASSKMADNSTSTELKEAIQDHLTETEGHVIRLEKIFSLLDIKPEAKKSEAMSSLIVEAQQIADATEEGAVRDAGIIFACQRIEHYEIASYGTLCSYAKNLDESDALALLEETIKEEKEGDNKLTEIAESMVNIDALHEHA